MTNAQRKVQVTIDKKAGYMTVKIPIENRISGSEKSIIVAGIQGSMKIMVGDTVHTLACSMYCKNPDYDAKAAERRRLEAKEANKSDTEVADVAKVVAA